jgi:hypothetical protein
MAAILEDAWTVYCHPEFARGHKGRQLLAQTKEWFASDDTTSWPFTFLNVCRVLGLDPEAVRTSLQQIAGTPPDTRVGTVHRLH